ncbi:hypothetical protein VP01_3559g2 [Puccinia sorghi]|uniref:Uncharacterized protein n=1 Tax=Puccinia sorghi TaxID=27349 RepID=A0A0L6UVD0_9BASI|nr:hypothetical protein VP01_3559g2 [Puccinia sorghi]
MILKFLLFGNFSVSFLKKRKHIGSISSICKVNKPLNQQFFFIHTKIFEQMDVNKFYRMREIQQTTQTFMNSLNVDTGLNIKHNCHDSDCELTETQFGFVEWRQRSNKYLEHTHLNDIISFSGVRTNSKQSIERINTLHEGLRVWQLVTEKKGTKASKTKPAALPTMDPSLK